MTKRPWEQVDRGHSTVSGLLRTQGQEVALPEIPGHNDPLLDDSQERARVESQRPRSANEDQYALREEQAAVLSQQLPVISRKVTACTACRRQKVRCINDGEERCRRCTEKNLSCVLNKSLQMLINERLPSTDVLLQDIEMVYNNVQTILKQLNLPTQTPLQSVKYSTCTPLSAEATDGKDLSLHDDRGPSCDNSPKMSPADANDLPRVPIQSVYYLTKLRAFRSPEASPEDSGLDRVQQSGQDQQDSAPNDFISKGLVQILDAQRLFRLYTDRLDNYFYNVGARYTDLATLRKASPILTAAILTIAAMHDPPSNSIYPICNREFRRMMTDSLFDRHIDRDHLRALCVASYWLNDSSWITSGIAARHGTVFNVASQFKKAVEDNDPEATDFIKIWYLVYICDQHLATLFGRECTTKEDVAVRGFEMLARAPVATTGDLRLLSQVALLGIIHEIRELFAFSEADQPIPAIFASQIKGFARQLDQWLSYWPALFPEYQENFGYFPRRGAAFHYQFASLYLYSHVFRGLKDSYIPTLFLDAAQKAVAAALAILDIIITDPIVQEALIGLPCYVQSMIGFACTFLGKVCTLYGDMVERAVVVERMTKITAIYRQTAVGKWHLIPLMADGLEKIIAVLGRTPTHTVSDSGYSTADPLRDMFGFDHDNTSMINLGPQYWLNSGTSDLETSQVPFFSLLEGQASQTLS